MEHSPPGQALTRGTFVNKRQLKPHVHAPVFVGDQLRFGMSSRTHIFSGAVELMPEEGLSREERRRLRALEKMSEKVGPARYRSIRHSMPV